MRYDDASGAFQASGPIANDDADQLSAGQKSASGNVITGEGTQYGAASADSAAGAQITAIAGKGGEDSSFAGGKLSVVGEHGRLTVDADGNYNYVVTGTVENVRDRFTYTLADNAGNSDTAALIVEIGKTPAVIKAGAQQVVPGPDGVVTLPPGVELSDVHVVGRNLVIDMPDGTQLVIIDGAIFVPQLVLGGVEIPATNVAALLIGQEVQPAAGEVPPSGGGNFALPPPPLDPGIPLGDLIPPTEYNYIPPDPQEVLDILDREPEITIQPDGQPASVAAVDSVDEKGLPTRNGGEPEGSGEEAAAGANGDPSEATAGTILINSPDGVDSVTINGVAVTGLAGQTIAGTYGTLTITGFDGDNILYSYVLNDNTSGNDTQDDFSVTVTDDDGDQATATLTIDIIDDVPTARPDTDAIAAGQYGPVTGNVITDASAGDADDGDSGRDTVGADDADLTAVTGFGSTTPVEGGWTVNGQYGVLSINTDGSYSYTRNEGTPGGVQDVFNYTLTDGDGDTSSTTLTITIADATPETRPNPTALLDDDALPGGIPGGTGDDPDAANLSGTLLGVGGDGPLTFDLLLTGAPAGFTYVNGPDGAVHVMQGATHVLTITLDSATGDYTVSQINPIDHPAGGDENNAQFTINYTVTDQDGDAANGTLNIDVDDDTPEMNRADVSVPTLTVDETNLAVNASADYSVVFAGAYGADGPGTTSYAVSVVNGTDSGLVDVATGDPILLFNNAGVVEGRVGGAGGAVAFTVSVNSGTGVVTLDQVRALEHPDNPDNDEGVSAVADSIQLTATITDGDGDSDSLSVNIGHTLTFEDDGPSVNPALNANATVTLDESLPSGTPGIDTGGIAKGDDPDLEGGLAIGQATSGSAIVNANAVFGADGPAASGSLVYALSITNPDPGVTLTDGTTITMQLVGGVIVGVVDSGPFDGQAAFAIAIDPSTGIVTVEQYLSLDHPVNPDPNDPLGLGDNTVAVTVTATDGDGDWVTSDGIDISGQITFLDDGPSIDPALNADADVTVDESLPSTDPTIDTGVIVKGNDPDLGGGLALGFATSGEAVVDAAAVFGADGPEVEGGVTYALSILGASSGVTLTDGSPINLQLVGGVIVGVVASGAFAGQAAFAIAIDANTGVVTVEQYLSLDHPVNPDPNDPLGLGDNTVGVTVTGTDGDGDPVTSDAVDISSLITFLDDGPSADAVLQENATAVLDESLPSTDPVIDTLGVVKGDDPDLGGGQAIGFDTTGSAVIDPNELFGADGPAAGGGVVYSLSVIGAASGLTVTDGSPINLQLLANGVIVGVVSGGAFNGQAAFAIAIDPTTGVVSVEQYLSLDHPDSSDHNDPLTMDELTVGVTATVTDGDGDSVTTDAVDISGQITFLDDGPNAAVNTGAPLDTLVLDETRPVGTEEDGDSAPAGLMMVQANFADNFVAPVNHGADGPGTVTYSFVLSGSNVNSGLYAIDPADTSAGDGDGIGRGTQIVLNQSGNTITGSAGGVDYFTITIDPATGVVTFTQLDNIWHANAGSDDDTSALMATLGSLLVRQTVTDGDGDSDTADVDVSQGVFQIEDDGPIARNDVDDIASGGETASGNVITGAGTNAGAANADDVGEDLPGRVSGLSSVNEPGNTDQDPAANVFEVDGEFGTLVLNADGSYTYTRFDGAPGNSQDVFTYTLIDADGDTETATLTINIGDAAPNLPDPPLVRLDDDVIPGANGNPEGVGDDDPDAPDDNVVNGTLAGTGGDGTLTYNFTGVTTLPLGFTYNQVDADTAQVLQGATVVMTIQLNQATGDFSVTQNNPIDHLAGDNENNYDFSIGVEVEDADGDVEPAAITINVDDDTPVASVVATGADVSVDETNGNQGDSNDVTGPLAVFNGVANKGTDADMAGPQFGTSAGAIVASTGSAYGADGAGTTVFGLSVTPGGVDSGLDTTAGVNIFLFLEGGIVVGRVGATAGAAAAGPAAFAVSIDPSTGVISMVQYMSLDHPTNPNPDEAVSILNSALQATVTVTDGDGDTATSSVNIGGHVQFQDDGPTAAIVTTGQTVSLDESAGNQVDSNDVTGPIAAFAGVANVGDDPDVAGTGPIQFATNVNALVAATGSAYGADGAGTTVFSLSVAPGGVDSGLDTTAGVNIFLFLENGVVVGRVGATAGDAAAGPAAFALAIDPSTGAVSMVEYLSIRHPNAGNPDDSVSILNAAVQATVTVTDGDGDTATNSVNIGSLISFQDSGPIMTSAQNMNIQNSGDVAHTAAFAFNLGADGANTSNDVITNVTGSATVGGNPVTNWSLVAGAENATTASYSFSFTYGIGGGNTANASGTLVFDKVAGTYTIDLANPIQGVTTILQTSQGTLFQGYEFGTSTPDGSQPEISVTQIQDLAGTANDIYVQFTSVSEPSSGTGDDNLEVTNWVPGGDNPPPVNSGGDTSWSAGQLFNQADGWVSTSNSANGVDGDTIQGGEVLDFNLVQGANPTGFLAPPASYAQASAMFLKFDGIGSGEDMIVILKLYDPNTNSYTTRAVMIENGDIQKGPGAGPGQYSGITLDNNDGLVIIESNDYNNPGETWVIVGAQIAGSDEGVTGTAIDLNSAIGAAGDSDTNNNGSLDTDALGFQSDTNDGPFKISSIGFLTTSTTPQNAELNFNVTVTDGDGDSITQAISATVTPAADSTSAATIPAGNVTINAAPLSSSKTAANDDYSSLLAGDSVQKSYANSGFGNVGNTGIVSSMVAASGLAMVSSSLQGFNDPSGSNLVQNDFQSLSVQAAGRDVMDSSSLAGISFGSQLGGSAADAVNLSSTGFNFDDYGIRGGSLDAMSFGDAEPAYVPNYASGEPSSFGVPAMAVNVPTVSMASAEMLQAAGLVGNVQHGGAIEQILADALGGHVPTIDGILANLPGGGIGELAAIANLASPDAAGVPTWDMAFGGAFGSGAEMVFKVAAVQVHQDAVQPA